MNMQDVKALARERGVKPGNMNKADLVRTLQAAEGNEACYGRGKAAQCEQDQCLWKDDCK